MRLNFWQWLGLGLLLLGLPLWWYKKHLENAPAAAPNPPVATQPTK